MSDEDILKAVANELKMYGDFDNIDYLIPQLGQAIENILAKYNRALSDLVKAEKEKNELKEEIEKFNKQLDLDYVDKNYISVSLVKRKKSELKSINFDTADDRDYIIRILDELIGEGNKNDSFRNKDKTRNSKLL